MKRTAGILLPIFSLPSAYGIGCFSKSAYDFVDWLKAAGQTYWQILPLGPTSYGDSPYQSFSTFAGNPYFISLEALIEEGVLTNRTLHIKSFMKTVILCCAKPMSGAVSRKIGRICVLWRKTVGGFQITLCLWR